HFQKLVRRIFAKGVKSHPAGSAKIPAPRVIRLAKRSVPGMAALKVGHPAKKSARLPPQTAGLAREQNLLAVLCLAFEPSGFGHAQLRKPGAVLVADHDASRLNVPLAAGEESPRAAALGRDRALCGAAHEGHGARA